MPYIKNEHRVFYNEFIVRMLQADDAFSENYGKELAKHVLEFDVTEQDGQLNYFLTKLFSLLNGLHAQLSLGTLKVFIIQVLCEVYSPKYFNYDRAAGMLLCVRKEYERRHGSRHAFLVKTFINGIIDTFYEEIVGPYEDKKIQENGDVE